MKSRKFLLSKLLIVLTVFFISSCSEPKKNVNLDAGIAKYGAWTGANNLVLIDKNGNLNSSKYLKFYSHSLSFTSNKDLSIFYLDTRGIGGKEFGMILVGKYHPTDSSLFNGTAYNMSDSTQAPVAFSLKLPAKASELVSVTPSVVLTIGADSYKGILKSDQKTSYFIAEMDFSSNGRPTQESKTKSDANNNGFFEEGFAYAYKANVLNSLDSSFSGGGGCKLVSKEGASTYLNMKFSILNKRDFSTEAPTKGADESNADFNARKKAYATKIKVWHNSSTKYLVEAKDNGTCNLSFEIEKEDRLTTPTYKISKVANLTGCDKVENLSTSAYSGFGSSFKDSGVALFGRFRGSVANGADAFYIDCEMHRRTFQ